MRGHVDPQTCLFSYFSIEEPLPIEHPLRAIKSQADAVLASMSPVFETMYADGGRPSVAMAIFLAANQRPDITASCTIKNWSDSNASILHRNRDS
ncbi:MAG: transposase [Sulfobacillus sp.]